MSYDINSQQVDIENLFKQNVNDLASIKELYRKLKDLEEKITQIKYIDTKIADKLKKDYESLKKVILDENIQIKLNNKIDETKTTLINNINELNSQVNNKINEVNSQLDTNARELENTKSSLEKSKASKTELEAERKRIDSFTSLAEGSTTGDAELIDGRVGVNGRTYTNIGGAIREQIRQLKDNFGTYRMEEIIMTDGQNIKLSVGVGNTVDLTSENVSDYRYAIVDCKEGDIFTISGKGGSNPRLWGFIDSNNVLLSVSDEGKREEGLLLTAPKNATKLIINKKKSGKVSYIGCNLSIIIDNDKADNMITKNTVDKLETSLLGKEITMTENLYIALGVGVGNVVDTTPLALSKYRYAIVDCKEGDIFTISGKGGNNPRLWGFIDSNNVLLSVSSEGITETELKLIAPPNARKLIINDLKTGKISYMGTSIPNKITEMEELISETKDNLIITQNDKVQETIEQISSIVDLIGIDFFKGKTVTITIPNKYTAWPFIGVSNNKLICVYARGLGHTDSYQKSSSLFVKTSKNGVVWSIEKEFLNTPNLRDTVTGKGNDSNGNMLIWIRKGSTGSSNRSLELYRTSDGNDFTQISTPTFSILPSHIGDIIYVPEVGLMAFYNTSGGNIYSWGLVISEDDGITWTQREIEGGLTRADCPVEISCIRTNDGKLLAIGRNEEATSDGIKAQYQLQSNDNGITWTKLRTNITDISGSTASLIYNSETDEISNYYYRRGEGKLKLRKSKVSDVWNNPTNWGTSKTITNASTSHNDAGNVNAVEFNGTHIISFYSGDPENTGIYAIIL